MRQARVVRSDSGYPSVETVQRYLPSNYQVTAFGVDYIIVAGEDKAGWTMDGYVIPRLGSGLIYAGEIKAGEVED